MSSYDFSLVNFLSSDPIIASEVVNNFVNFIDKETVRTLKEDILKSLASRIEERRKLITDKREIARQNRLDEIHRLIADDSIKRKDIKNKIKTLVKKTQKEFEDKKVILEEAKTIANRIKLIEPSLPAITSNDKSTDLMISTQQIPEYMRGVNALNAEIESIKERKNNVAFIAGLRDLERELELLKENPQIIALKNRENDDPFILDLPNIQQEINRLTFVEKNIGLMTDSKSIVIDQSAIIPEHRIGPKRKRIVILGLFLGIFMGIIIAYMLHSFKSFKHDRK